MSADDPSRYEERVWTDEDYEYDLADGAEED